MRDATGSFNWTSSSTKRPHKLLDPKFKRANRRTLTYTEGSRRQRAAHYTDQEVFVNEILREYFDPPTQLQIFDGVCNNNTV
jgi:hypothetical protein